MTELDPEEEAVLEGVRRALSPPDVVTRRMRTALVAKLAAPGILVGAGAAAASTTSAAGAASSAATSSGAAAASGAMAGSSAAPLAAVAGGAVASGAKLAVSAVFLKAAAGVATAVVVATATSSYWLPEASAPAAAPPPSAATLATARTAARAPRAPATTGAMSGATVTQQPEATSPTDPRLANAGDPIRRSAAPNDTPQQSSTPQQKLQGELDMLRQAQQAVQAGQPARALELLARLDAEYPKSSLRQEREVARVLALCGAGQVSAARDIAQRILRASPNSLYAGRLQASCAAIPVPPVQGPASTSVGSPSKSTNSAPPVARFGDSGN